MASQTNHNILTLPFEKNFADWQITHQDISQKIISKFLLQQARSRDLPSYTSSSLPPLTDGDGGGRDSLTSGASTIIQEKCCSRMT